MIKENIEKIKKAEEESEKIIKSAELKTKRKLDNIVVEIEEIKKELEKKLEKEIGKYKLEKEKDKKGKIQNLQNQNESTKEKIRKKEEKINETVEKIWKEILNELYSNHSILP